MLDQMKPRPPPGMPQRNSQNQRSNSSLGQKPSVVSQPQPSQNGGLRRQASAQGLRANNPYEPSTMPGGMPPPQPQPQVAPPQPQARMITLRPDQVNMAQPQEAQRNSLPPQSI